MAFTTALIPVGSHANGIEVLGYTETRRLVFGALGAKREKFKHMVEYGSQNGLY